VSFLPIVNDQSRDLFCISQSSQPLSLVVPPPPRGVLLAAAAGLKQQ
jgi:hypothetical protein